MNSEKLANLWRRVVYIYILTLLLAPQMAHSGGQFEFGKDENGKLKSGCYLASSVKFKISKLEFGKTPSFAARKGEDWKVHNAEEAFNSLDAGPLLFKGEERELQYSHFSNKLLKDGFVVNWRSNSKYFSLYITWSSLTGNSQGNRIVCVQDLSKMPSIIHKTQMALTVLGYNPGRVDGKWGNKTKQAVLTFQQETGIRQTGRLDSLTLEKFGIK